MDSPQNIGDTTAGSISKQLLGTHLNRSPLKRPLKEALKQKAPSILKSAVFSGQKFVQMSLVLHDSKQIPPIDVLRRVQDSYINVSQLLHILVVSGQYSQGQADAFIRNEIVSNTQFHPGSHKFSLPLFNDFSTHEVAHLRGIWVPFDKALAFAVKLDIYAVAKPLFLADMQDFDSLPKASVPPGGPPSISNPVSVSPSKRANQEEKYGTGSPVKRSRLSVNGTVVQEKEFTQLVSGNPNYPYALPPVIFEEAHRDLISEAKMLFHEIFKHEEKDSLSKSDVEMRLKQIFVKCKQMGLHPGSVLDVPLDPRGKTALHYAATLACENLVESFIEFEICSPIRGDNKGETSILAMIQVTNAMTKGNFYEMLNAWLWPGLWLFDNNNQSFLHYLVQSALKNFRSSKFYFGKILEWAIGSVHKKQHLDTICKKIVNAQDSTSGNTALHLAGENGFKWFVYLLLELGADITLTNNMGVKPTSFDSVNQVVNARKTFKKNPVSSATTSALLEALDTHDDNDEYLISLVHTGIEFWIKSAPFPELGHLENEPSEAEPKECTPTSEVFSSSLLSNKIFKSIQDLLSNANGEYESVIHSKRAEINTLNRELRDTTIVTANNRLIAKDISAKMAQIETMKLQMMNINDKMQMLKREFGRSTDDENFNAEWDLDIESLEKYDADQPFIIPEIYDKLAQGEKITTTPELLESLPSQEVLKARLKAYEEVNENLEKELEILVDYEDLTAQFKKVVSSCTGVDINEVDELLDGLLEAVEGQQ